METPKNTDQGGISFSQLLSLAEDESNDFIKWNAGLVAFEKEKLDAFWKIKESELSDKSKTQHKIRHPLKIDDHIIYYVISEIGYPSLRFLSDHNQLARTIHKETLLSVASIQSGYSIYEINTLSAAKTLLTELDQRAVFTAEPSGQLTVDRERWGWDFSSIPEVGKLPAEAYRNIFRMLNITDDQLPSLTSNALPYSVTFRAFQDEVRPEQVLAYVVPPTEDHMPRTVSNPLLVGDGQGLTLPPPYTTPLSATVVIRKDTPSPQELCEAIPQLLMPGQIFKNQQEVVQGLADRVGVFEPTEVVSQSKVTERSGLPYSPLAVLEPGAQFKLGLFPDGAGIWELEPGAKGQIEENCYISPSLSRDEFFIYETATARHSDLTYKTALLTTSSRALSFKLEIINTHLKLTPIFELLPGDTLTWEVLHGDGSIKDGEFFPTAGGDSSFSVVALSIEFQDINGRTTANAIKVDGKSNTFVAKGFYVIPVPLLSVTEAYDLLTGNVLEAVSMTPQT